MALRASLAAMPGAATDLSRRFTRASPATVTNMLEKLITMGQARRDAQGRYRL